MSTGDVLLQGKHICKSYQQGKKSNRVLNDVHIEIYDGDFTVIMGSSGAGKSTLLYCLSGMDSISDGEVLYRGEEISRYSEKQMTSLRTKEFGFVFQQTHLVSNLTLFENVAVAGYAGGEERQKRFRIKLGNFLPECAWRMQPCGFPHRYPVGRHRGRLLQGQSSTVPVWYLPTSRQGH